MQLYLCNQHNVIGPATRQVMQEFGIKQIPIRSNGVEGAQTFGNLIISRTEVTRFNDWVDDIDDDLAPGDPVCLDYEGPMAEAQGDPWWRFARGDLIPEVGLGLRIVAAYGAGLYFALRANPRLGWGTWGLPDAKMTLITPESPHYWWRRAFMGMLAGYPDWHPQGYLMPGQVNAGWVRPHLERVVSASNGMNRIIAWFNMRHGRNHGSALVDPTVLSNHMAYSTNNYTLPIHGRCVWTYDDHDQEDADALRVIAEAA